MALLRDAVASLLHLASVRRVATRLRAHSKRSKPPMAVVVGTLFPQARALPVNAPTLDSLPPLAHDVIILYETYSYMLFTTYPEQWSSEGGSMSRLRPVLFALALLAPILLGGVTHPVEAVTGVRIVVNCFSNPETTRVMNKTAGTITIRTVGSIYQPYSYEPIPVNRTLPPGSSISFQSGGGPRPARTSSRATTSTTTMLAPPREHA